MTPDDAGSSTRDRRQARLAASLRENLKRRKAQQRSRGAAGIGSVAVEEGPATVPEAHPKLPADDAMR